MVGDLNEDEWLYQCPTKIEGSIFKSKKGTCPESLQYRARAKIRADNDFKLDIKRICKDAEQEVVKAITRDRKSTRLKSSHPSRSRMPSSA